MMQINNNLWHDSCPICSSSNICKVGFINYSSSLHYSTQTVEILLEPELWRCKFCKSRFVQNAIPENQSIALYEQGDSEKRWVVKDFETSKTRIVVSTIRKYLKVGSSILDIGCNTGELLDFARSEGCKTFGIEYSKSSLSILEGKGHVGYSKIEEVREPMDCIIACDLVEHLYNLPRFLDTCAKKLAPNGNLIVLTGNIESIWSKLLGSGWWYVQYPEHIVFPSKKYFESHQKLRVVDWIPTYAAPWYQQPFIPASKNIIRSYIKGSYNGLPSATPDHNLVILKSK